MATNKKKDQPSNPQKDRADMLAQQATKLREELRAAKDREDGLRMERAQLEKANGDLSKKLDAFVERIKVGGKFNRIRRVNHGLHGYELLGILTQAVDEVKAQLSGSMPQPERHVVEHRKAEQNN